MSDTPRTDEVSVREYAGAWDWCQADFARQLERELAAVTKELAEIQGENTRLRAALAQSSGACVYCSLPKEQWAACQSGFPGCARADDAMGCPELGARMERDEALARIKRLEEESESRWKLAEAAIKSCAEMSSRIKRLEEAGDNLHFAFIDGYVDDICLMNWVKAKEAQP